MPDLDNKICRGCPYHPSEGRVPPPRDGRAHVPLSAEINGSETLLLLQAPGINEWSDGKPLSSGENNSASQRFNAALAKAGKTREEFDIAEAVNCYPGQDERGRDLPPLSPVVKACSRWLAELIKEKQYKTVVLFGNVAAQALALAWFSDPTVARSITRIVKNRYINLVSVKSIAKALTEPEPEPEPEPE
ncbi:hypothetical protein D7X74_02850 [Corallococcus sp. CA047B]|uniref:uracil-DNA glycosylase family protein n=1 Tax=Corallococcus sp. CA047B TaxID=2316729 RepID=UPI000EA3E66E|nr:uracil-DNA glycosylase family protein [Corallococcus sp. CA047B]RKH20848.1 hypothetical protein D7X74_02850 [Corallococcus sp. CA047B]